jgi:hypothetical protein
MLAASLVALAFAIAFGLLAWRLFLCGLRAPDFVIGKPGSVYMNRWYVIPRNRLFNIYLHQVLRSDDDRALHDHPWLNLSVVLKGGYREVMPASRPSNDWPVPPQWSVWRGPGSIVLRRPTAAHRLEIDPVAANGETCWSLFVTGPNVRGWGFWCPRGWKPWREFVDMTNTGAIGPGCGEGDR